jgi:iron-sulfur cluster assembly accessory protein
MIEFSKAAIAKTRHARSGAGIGVEHLMPKYLRLGVQGGGCTGFQYSMAFTNEKGPLDTEYEFDGEKVIVDGISKMYLEGTRVDYIETLESSGFKFENPNVKTTCGCGKSFSA